MTNSDGDQPALRVRQVEVNGRQPWVLEDDIGIVELADTKETLLEDNPQLRDPAD